MTEIYLVDIGASGGIHPRWENTFQQVKAVLFEPDPREYDRLKEAVGDNYIVLNAALSEAPEKVDFYLCKDQKASSLYPPDLAILRRYYADMEKFEIVKKIKVVADTLDNQLKEAKLFDIDFIKVDVQGHELPILRGGIDTLQRVIGIEVEVEFLPVYQGQPVFSEVDCFLRDSGFELFDIKRTFRNRRDKKNYGNRKGQLLWGDALYFKSPESVLSISNISAEKVMRAISIYMVYGYPDVADTMYHMAKERSLIRAETGGKIEALLAQYEVEKMNVLPQFRGARKLSGIFTKLAQTFTHTRRTDKQQDEYLGNP